MFFNSIAVALRYLKKSLLSFLINLLGLAIGMTAFILIIQYVRFELSYDNFHDLGDRIYRIQQDRYNKGELTTQWAAGCSAVGQALYENFPEVENFTRFSTAEGIISYDDRRFKETKIYLADSSFFEVFSFSLIEGDPSNILEKPFETALSESAATKYFGDEEAVGKSLLFNDGLELNIVGIFRDAPIHSHLHPGIVVSWETLVSLQGPEVNTAWQWDGFLNYIVLSPQTDYKEFEAKIPAYIEERVGDELRQFNSWAVYNLQPLRKIHLYSDFMMEMEVNGNARSTYALLIVAIFLVLIAWINYINLSTAKSLERAKEVGIRKISGASRDQLIRQFLSESILINLLGALLAIILVQLLNPVFNQITGKPLDFGIPGNPAFWGIMLLVFITGAVLSGTYPAFFLSSFKPAIIIKGNYGKQARGIILRKSLVIFQFITSLILISGTLVVYRQISFMQHYDLGVDIENILVLPGPNITDSTYTETFNAFKEELLRNPNISKVSTSTSVPGRKATWNAGGIHLLSQDVTEGNQYRIIGMDFDFVDLYGLQVLEGRNFSPEYGMNPETVLFNENAIRLIGFDDYKEALDKQIFFWGDTFRIVGILKNYHQQGLKEVQDPLIFRFFESVTAYYSVKLVPAADIQALLPFVQEQWEIFFSKNPFEYFFLDEYYNEQYKDDLQFGTVFGSFSLLAIIIACLGLFGLSSYATTQRTREIGIRKVLGASVPQSILLLVRYFLNQILISVPIGLAGSYFIMSHWIRNFPFRISIGWWFFVLPVLVVLIISLITVIAQVFKTANVNPAESLRYE